MEAGLQGKQVLKGWNEGDLGRSSLFPSSSTAQSATCRKHGLC
jgi:hypothetical protein